MNPSPDPWPVNLNPILQGRGALLARHSETRESVNVEVMEARAGDGGLFFQPKEEK